MDVKLKKVKDMKIKLLGKSAFTIPTKPNMFKLNTLMYIVAKRGGGKTSLATSLIKELFDDGVLDRLILVSPTFHSNRDMFSTMPNFNEQEDVLYPDQNSPALIEKKIQDMADAVNNYLSQLEVYKELKRNKNKNELIMDNMELYYENEIINENGNLIKPIQPFKNLYPRVFVLIDDSVGTNLMIGRGARDLSKLCLTHRHLGKHRDGVLGCSLAILSQTISTHGGLSRCVRENSTIVAIKPTKDKVKLKQYYTELADDITEDEFYMLLHIATKDNEYNFLLIDYSPKDPKKKYRKNMDTFIDIEDVRKLLKDAEQKPEEIILNEKK